MNDPLPASNWLQQLGTGYDANIPRSLRGQTRTVSAWAGTLQLSAFIALVTLPIILVTEAWQAPTGAAATALACAAAPPLLPPLPAYPRQLSGACPPAAASGPSAGTA